MSEISSAFAEQYGLEVRHHFRTASKELWAAKHLHRQARKDFPATPTWNTLSEDYRNAFMLAGKHAVSRWPIKFPRKFGKR